MTSTKCKWLRVVAHTCNDCAVKAGGLRVKDQPRLCADPGSSKREDALLQRCNSKEY